MSSVFAGSDGGHCSGNETLLFLVLSGSGIVIRQHWDTFLRWERGYAIHIFGSKYRVYSAASACITSHKPDTICLTTHRNVPDRTQLKNNMKNWRTHRLDKRFLWHSTDIATQQVIYHNIRVLHNWRPRQTVTFVRVRLRCRGQACVCNGVTLSFIAHWNISHNARKHMAYNHIHRPRASSVPRHITISL